MKFKGFEELPKDIPIAETGKKPAASEAAPKPPETALPKVDRRPRSFSDLSNEELVDKVIHALVTDESSAEEISARVNQGLRDIVVAREARRTKDLQDKFGGLSDEELVKEAVFTAVEDPDMAKEITKRVNQSLRAKAKAEERKKTQKEPGVAEEVAA